MIPIKTRYLRIALCFLFFCFFVFSSQAQQQSRWVTGGGTNENLTSEPLATEGTQYMCTDANGNVYAVSQVGNNAIYADTFVRSTGAYGSDFNVLITSYNCYGQMRWAKLIASSGDGECLAEGIVSDSFGHLYVSGVFQPLGSTLYIGYDTTISGIDYLSGCLMQFDTSGHFNWIRYIGDNTLSTLEGAGAGPIILDGINNVHLFANLKDGVHITSTETSIYGVYDLEYSSSGTLLSSVRLDLDSEWFLNGVVIDPVSNKLYVSGQNNQFIFGGVSIDSFFAAAFDTSRHLLWQYYCEPGALTGISLDPSKHLYFSGASYTSFIFNGASALTAPGFFTAGVVMKTDTNGHPEWIRHYDSRSSVNGFNGITLLPNNMVAAVGTFVESVTNGMDSLTTRPGYYWSPYIVVVDSAGNLQTMQQAYGDGFQNEGLVITSDKVGNIYFGGEVTDSIFGGTVPAYHTVGGNTDFFVMKYGVDCSCTSGPTAAYTDTGNHTIGVTYTGTTSGLDSVVWNFGDGATDTGINAVHTYTATGWYNVCVTTYTDCGIDEYCSSFVYRIDTPSLVGNVTGMTNINIYPNPTLTLLTVTVSNKITSVNITNLLGQTVYSNQYNTPQVQVDVSDLPTGMYLLKINGSEVRKFVKQ